ncbi:MAG: IS110 family transposase [Fibrobacterota bacterium]|nr:IS110 family transposase [Chitinispirillaceae bacterium]
MNLTVSTEYLCGIDLHAREMRICVMDRDGKILLKRNLPCAIKEFISHVKPFMKSLTVGVESTFNWYWLLDKLKEHKITAALGHALYIKRMKSGKHKNDPVDARDIADLLRTNRFPLAYDYPSEMRAVRDLLRRRHHFVRKRAAAYTHFQNTFTQHGILDTVYALVKIQGKRRELLELAVNNDMRKIIETDLDYIDSLDTIIKEVENLIIKRARHHNRKHFDLLQTIIGCGPITSLVILYETHTIERFCTPQRYSSYSRVISADNESSGKYLGHSPTDKIGNPYLKWAFSEIAIHMLKDSPEAKDWFNNVSAICGASGARARLRHKIAVAVFHMLKKNVAFDEFKFFNITNDRTGSSAHNWMETSGEKTKPHGLIGKKSGHSSKTKVTTKKVSVKSKGTVKKSSGRKTLRTTGKVKA